MNTEKTIVNGLEFYLPKEYSLSDLKRMQQRLLEMGCCITEILESHNIPYIIGYGTLLGAVRDGGFIPWDDDLDIMLFDDTYDMAVEYLREELPGDMFVEDEKSEPLYFHQWAHVKDTNSEVRYARFNQDSAYKHQGITFDLYKLTKIKRKDVDSFVNDENKKYIERRRKKGLMSDEEYADRTQKLQAKIEADKNNVNNEERDVYGLVIMYDCKYLEIDDVLPVKRYKFEGHDFWGPANADNILTKIYGRYMEYPEIDKRKVNIASIKFFETEDE